MKATRTLRGIRCIIAGLLPLCLCTGFASAQLWEHYAPSTGSVQINAMAGSSTIIAYCGTESTNDGSVVMIVVALTQQGDTAWVRRAAARSHGLAVMLTSRNEITAAGIRWDEGWKGMVVRWKADGTQVWEHIIDGGANSSTLPRACQTLDDGSVAVACDFHDGESADAVLLLVDEHGDEMWRHVEKDARFNDLALQRHASGVFLLAAGSTGGPGAENSLLQQFDVDGTLLKTLSLDLMPQDSDCLRLIRGNAAGITAAGEMRRPDGGTTPVMVNVETPWTPSTLALITQPGRHCVTDMALSPDNHVLMTIRQESVTGAMDARISCFDRKGVEQWSTVVDNAGQDSDTHAPRFHGLEGGWPGAKGEIVLVWAPAADDMWKEGELVYDVYFAQASGEQDFTAPWRSVRDRHLLRIDGLEAASAYYCIVRARDADGNSDENFREVLLYAGGSGLRIITAELSPGIRGKEYLQSLSATGGNAPYAWSLVEGILPDGLTLHEEGTISGIPSRAESQTCILRVNDAAGDTASRGFTLHIAGEALHVTTSTLPDSRVCEPYAVQLNAEGGATPYRWSIIDGELPDGITLSFDGMLRGAATTPGSYTMTVRVQDAANAVAEATLDLLLLRAARLVVVGEQTLSSGRHCFSTVEIPRGSMLRITAPAELLVSDSLLVDGTLFVDCGTLRIIGYDFLRVRGAIVDTCSGSFVNPDAQLLLFSRQGSVQLGDGSIEAVLLADVDVLITDDSMLTDLDDVLPLAFRSTVSLDPVCSVTAGQALWMMAPGDTLNIEFTCDGIDPDGGAVSFTVDGGAGIIQRDIIPEDGRTAMVTLPFSQFGSYEIVCTVHDDDGRSSQSRQRIVIVDATEETLAGAGLITAADDIILPVFDTLWLYLKHESLSAEVDSVLWEFGDGRSSTELEPGVVWATPGRYDMRCTVHDSDGDVQVSTWSLYVYQSDSTRVAAQQGEFDTEFLQRPGHATAVVDAPVVVRGRIVFRGYQHLRFDPGARIQPRPVAGAPPGFDGRGGRGLLVNVPSGWLVLNNANIRAGNGAPGGIGNVNGRPSGKGGNGGSLSFYGRNIYVTGGTYSAGDGADGGAATVFAPADGTARAFGRRGGNAGHHVRFRATNSITFNGPVTIHTGNAGKGGDATATGGNGADRCTVGQNGAKALARAGAGGSARKQGVVRGNVTGAQHITLTGGQGGDGGNAIANGGDGGNALGCKTTAVGGRGGWARSFGGDGGASGHQGVRFAGSENFRPGKAGNATSAPGNGGDASAVGDPKDGNDGCPGDAGGNATSVGGRGGDGLAISGKKGKLYGQGIQADAGQATVNGSNGGSAIATAGNGGNGRGSAGADCDCDGGPGGSANATGGLRGDTKAKAQDGGSSTEAKGLDGTADALGGRGGDGGECCTPPAPSGGNGGAGGDASANSGNNGGTSLAIAGNGGDGGDGKGPGVGGQGGKASITGSGSAVDGNDGDDGEWCFLIETWYIYFSSIPDGIIPPGTDLPLGTYPERVAVNQNGTIVIRTMTDTETGIPLPPSYMKMGDELFIESGGIRIECSTLKETAYPDRVWNTAKVTITLNGLSPMGGDYRIIGRAGGEILAESTVSYTPSAPTQSGSITAPEGRHFDTVSIVTDGAVSLNHWEVEILVIDP